MKSLFKYLLFLLLIANSLHASAAILSISKTMTSSCSIGSVSNTPGFGNNLNWTTLTTEQTGSGGVRAAIPFTVQAPGADGAATSFKITMSQPTISVTSGTAIAPALNTASTYVAAFDALQAGNLKGNSIGYGGAVTATDIPAVVGTNTYYFAMHFVPSVPSYVFASGNTYQGQATITCS